jgi:nucleotide-binding universal stress UspA family protein
MPADNPVSVLRTGFHCRAYRSAMNSPFANVTVAVDGSDTARRALAYAIELARGGAALHFCSVVDTSAAGLSGAIGTPFDPIPVIQASEDEARRACLDAVTEAAKCGITSDGKVVYGPVAPSVGRFASDVRSNAVVIGTHARRGLARAFFGSITESLLAISSIPVVVTHADDEVQMTGPVTVAVDGSAASRAALRFAIALACSWKVSLAIVNVTSGDRDDWQAASDLLDDAAESAREAGVDFELITIAGQPVAAIVDGAERRKSSAIVVGTGSHSSVASFLLGSVAAMVLERARVPVIVVPVR